MNFHGSKIKIHYSLILAGHVSFFIFYKIIKVFERKKNWHIKYLVEYKMKARSWIEDVCSIGLIWTYPIYTQEEDKDCTYSMNISRG